MVVLDPTFCRSSSWSLWCFLILLFSPRAGKWVRLPGTSWGVCGLGYDRTPSAWEGGSLPGAARVFSSLLLYCYGVCVRSGEAGIVVFNLGAVAVKQMCSAGAPQKFLFVCLFVPNLFSVCLLFLSIIPAHSHSPPGSSKESMFPLSTFQNWDKCCKSLENEEGGVDVLIGVWAQNVLIGDSHLKKPVQNRTMEWWSQKERKNGGKGYWERCDTSEVRHSTLTAEQCSPL